MNERSKSSIGTHPSLIMARPLATHSAARVIPPRGFRSVDTPGAALRIATAIAPDGSELMRAVDLRVAPVTEQAPMVDRRDPARRAYILRAILLALQPLDLDHDVLDAVLALGRCHVDEEVGDERVGHARMEVRNLKPEPVVLGPRHDVRRLVESSRHGTLPTRVADRLREVAPKRRLTGLDGEER